MAVVTAIVFLLLAIAVVLLISTVLVQAGLRRRAAIVTSAIATPILFALVPLLPGLVGALAGRSIFGVP